MDLKTRALALHKKLRGKIEIASRAKIKSLKDLDLLYTPGVADVSREIAADKEKVYDFTNKWNSVAIITDGTRVLGLGNIGPEAALPVMEGKALIAKEFGNVDAFPICLKTQDKEKIIETVKAISPSFGLINIEDIEAPKCFEIVERLEDELDIPVFHDDQHGTAIVVLAALLNSLKIIEENTKAVKIVIAGAGAAGYGITKILSKYGFRNIIVSDSMGIIYEGRPLGMNTYKNDIAKISNHNRESGILEEAIENCDVFIGASGIKNLIDYKVLQKMSKNAIVFLLSNPDPEILPSQAQKAKNVKIIATGRSDFPNQINNAITFPAIFRGALDSRVKKLTYDMFIKAAEALANSVPKNKLSKNYIIPNINEKYFFDKVVGAIK
ncbi:TPA: NADP-dependent malic enzyme [archaeon]|uniref:NADP-dependent malic enzyme n=1 Tax=Candidatus Naiadarchaeum limnaeum TaxID=2756139 RepID=A0A832V3J3_9ARCH|nr:NADP-dependent malic enzyme [Candidatus Naiadarchaeum limnaeum]